MTIAYDGYLAAKFVWEEFSASKHAQYLDDRGLANATVALDARSHGPASPLTVEVPRISKYSQNDARTLTRRLVQLAEGRFILQLESLTLEWLTFLLGLCREIPVLQVSRPRCGLTEVMNTALGIPEGDLEILCFLNNIIAEDSCAQTGSFFASLLYCCRTRLKSTVYDIFSVASLANLFDSLASVDPVAKSDASSPHVIDAKQLKTVCILVPFKLDRDSQLSPTSASDLASLVGRLFAEERLEVTDATLVVWACYPRELVDCGDHSETAIRSQLRKELEPHIERLRELAPIRVSECGESRRVPPFRKVDLRVCPYEEWHAGGIAEIPVEVWEEALAGIEADGASSSGASAEARAGEART